MKKVTFFMGLLLCANLVVSQTNVLPDIQLVAFADGFTQPVGIETAGDERLFVVEQTGKIRIVGPDGSWKSHFLNMSDKISTAGFEQGLLGLTFHPDYEENGYFYIHYTNLDGNSTISRFNVNPNNPSKALPSSEVILFVNDDPFRNHNSGQLAFGPDGYLYFAMGDGGSGGDPLNNGQDLSTTFGKLMRMETTDEGWEVPATNPYVGMEGVAEEIWASGLRNPWRFSFDRLTGDLWIPDVGQNLWEEVNYTPASSTGGENYGWSCMEASHFFKADCEDNGIPFTDPIAEYAHSDDPQFLCSGSITGGFVYRGALYPDMYGKYIYTDFCTGVIRTTYWSGSAWVTAELGDFTPFAYSTFGQDIYGELYLADKTSGVIYRVTDGGGAPFAAIPQDLQPDIDRDAIPVSLLNDMEDKDEVIRQALHQSSASIHRVAEGIEIEVSPNPNGGQFRMNFMADQDDECQMRICDMMGQKVYDQTKDVVKGINNWEIQTANLAPGVYLLQMHSGEKISIAKFVVE